jgi:LuxR family transcriptional regulator, maltose regulon positive regulatory protein
MAMTFSLSHSIESDGSLEQIGVNSLSLRGKGYASPDKFHLLRSKLEVPTLPAGTQRPRIHSLLARSIDQFPATLISGRSGTGKTSIAAAFAEHHGNIAWYTVESSDREWPVFSRYFHDMLFRDPDSELKAEEGRNEPQEPSEFEIARFVLNSFKRSLKGDQPQPRLLILDDIHHIFDTEWFDSFFELLLYSLPEDHRLLMLCRSKPPGPLWRLRSKQMLNVIDEKVIEFTGKETEQLFAQYGLSAAIARAAHRSCYGRASRLIEFAEHALAEND